MTLPSRASPIAVLVLLALLVGCAKDAPASAPDGGTPGKPLPPIADFKMAKHTKANAQGIKAAKPGLAVVPRAKFKRLASIQEVYDALFLAAAPFTP